MNSRRAPQPPSAGQKSSGGSKLIDVQSPDSTGLPSLAPPAPQATSRPASTIDDLLDLNFSQPNAPNQTQAGLFPDMDPFRLDNLSVC